MLFEKKTNLLFLLREHINMVFLLRELVCVFTARTQPKKNCLFLLHELGKCFHVTNQGKKNLFTARTRVLLLRELNKKKMFLFTARTCVWSHRVNSEKNKKIYCTNSITISFEISCSYCANLNFFQNARTVSKACQKFILSISVTNIKKNETFLIVPTVKTKLFLLHELNKKHESDSYCS